MGKQWKQWQTFIWGGSKITADDDYSREIKRCLLLRRKAMINLNSILKSRDITLPIMVHLVEAIVFPVVMYGCESWDYKESWAPKNWCLWTVILEKTLESPLDCKEIQLVHPKRNQSWVFIRRTDAEVELQYFGHPMQRTDSLEKTLMLGKTESRRRRGWNGWMASLTWQTWVWVSSGSLWWTGRPGVLQCMESQRVRHDWVTELTHSSHSCSTIKT